MTIFQNLHLRDRQNGPFCFFPCIIFFGIFYLQQETYNFTHAAKQSFFINWRRTFLKFYLATEKCKISPFADFFKKKFCNKNFFYFTTHTITFWNFSLQDGKDWQSGQVWQGGIGGQGGQGRHKYLKFQPLEFFRHNKKFSNFTLVIYFPCNKLFFKFMFCSIFFSFPAIKTFLISSPPIEYFNFPSKVDKVCNVDNGHGGKGGQEGHGGQEKFIFQSLKLTFLECFPIDKKISNLTPCSRNFLIFSLHQNFLHLQQERSNVNPDTIFWDFFPCNKKNLNFTPSSRKFWNLHQCFPSTRRF